MRLLGISLALGVLATCAAPGCYSTGDGTAPPPNQIYFPVGLGVSRGGNVLYIANSDFDLQWNGGTMQSYDLHLIREHVVLSIDDPNNRNLPLVRPATGVTCDTPSQDVPVYQTDGSGQRQPLGETCAPPVDGSIYVRDSATIGAFATDLQLAKPRSACVPDTSPRLFPGCSDIDCAVGSHCERSAGSDRLFIPVRGDASLTWADITPDDPTSAPAEDDTADKYAPFRLDCGTRSAGRCDAAHHAGNDGNEPGNTRQITMPGEPFGMAQSEDGTIIAITHQTDTKVSLLSTGLDVVRANPALQFVLDGVASGGNGIYAIPHDPQAFDTSQIPHPAFLETSRASTDISLLRYYSDEGYTVPTGGGLSGPRPFLVKEGVFTLSANAGGTDSRGIVIDPTPRTVCKSLVPPAGPGRPQSAVAVDLGNCARLPARVYFANRSPASIIVAEVGEPSAAGDGTYDPDRLQVFGNIPLSFGPSKLYLAPIVDADGNYALRLWVVCFDSQSVFVIDPNTNAVENILRVGAGPFALAFDPFDLDEAALHRKVPADSREPGLDLKRYRFAYLASFTKSYVQVIDLDNSRTKKDTFEKVVYTLGLPTLPKGSQ
jgi:YVTN family beta-propeller protein